MNGKPYVIEPLDTQKHDRAAFSSDVAPLDIYLKSQAAQDTRRKIAVTYVLRGEEPGRIIGYYTLSTASIETISLPEHIIKRLPRYNVLPTMLIGRLAVDEQYRGRRLGELLLADALKRCWALSQEIGSMAVCVDAKDEGAARFYERYGFRRFEDRPQSLFMPMLEIARLV